MPLLSIVASSALAAARLKIAPSDYFLDPLQGQRSGAALVDVLIEPNGHVAHCAILRKFGDYDLASQVCWIIKSRRATPARLADNSKVYGRIVDIMKFFVPNTPQGDEIEALQRGPDVGIAPFPLPGGADHQRLHVDVAVDQAGDVTDCLPAKGVFPDEATLKALAESVCNAHVITKLPVEQDTQGKPVAYVRDLIVDLRRTKTDAPKP